MESPKPKPPVQKPTTKPTAPKKSTQAEQVKTANFKLKRHLTHRPFSDEALFAKLRDQAKDHDPVPYTQHTGSSKAKREGRK